ncbi:Ig-like domain-containing protein [Nannocystis bainbridge]|uniref:Ig-like domain-containing protein n=1 Tax=Nannocystis bainbridge TaxID=2995303 RepID=A0ABT5DT22_9BACT|nr:Ig-like domain-containing protein [Nannocystis bainbridge]MDC0715878.1 Ig-like domain-containing protein [Nannocystis bainbridge]
MTFTTDRRKRMFVLSFATCLVSNAAGAAPYVQSAAAEPEPTGVRAAPLLPPASQGTTRLKANVPPSAVGQAQTNVFFLNYDGVTLKATGKDDAKKDESAFKEFAGEYAPYGEGSKRAASLQAVKADWAKYKVVITDERPDQGEYTMCVNSPTNVFGGGVLGVAMLDCEDKKVASNVVLAFHSAKDKYSAATQATTMSQEIAHAYGLEHVNEPDDIMNPYNAGGDPSFRDECLKLDTKVQVHCGAQHKQFCDKGQNSHAELMWLFGANEPDPTPPTVAITSPQDGQEFVSPAAVTITVEASDNVGVARVDLYVDGVDQAAPVTAPPYEWKDANFPEGSFCLTAEARDDEPNVVMSDPVCFTVVAASEPGEGDTGEAPNGGGEPMPGGEPGGSTGESEPQGGESTGSTSGDSQGEGDSDSDDSTGADDSTGGAGGAGATDSGGPVVPPGPLFPPGWGQQDSDDGCGCAQSSGSGAGLLALLGAFAVRRRRRR